MTSLVVTPDVEDLVVTALRSALTGRGDTAVVSTKITSKHQDGAGNWVDRRPPRLVRIRRRGGPRKDIALDVPRLLIECWDAAGETAAAALCGLVCGLIADLPDGGRIAEAQILSGPSNDPDPDSETPRYTATAQLWVNSA